MARVRTELQSEASLYDRLALLFSGARWQGGRRVEARGKKEDSQRGGVGGCTVLDAAGL